MKRYTALTIFFAVLVIPAMMFAADKLAVGKAEVAEQTVVVPLEVSNMDGLMAMDLPLKFSEGVILKEVRFEDTRSSYFDMKIADIDNDNHTVAIGLITQITATPKDELTKGTGPVANLVFEIVDAELAEISIEAIEMSKPDHSLMFIYQEYDGDRVVDQRVETPEFEAVTVVLSGAVAGLVPDQYGLAQNYPNPFNPSTNIQFSLANAGNYELNIYNVLGQNVTEFSGAGEAGINSVEWDATSFASGVYFYKLTAADFSATKKMILLK